MDIERLKGFISRRAERLGISVDEVLKEGGEKPNFVKAAENRAARQGLKPEEVLERDAARLRTPSYPAIECLMGYEVEQVQEGVPLSEDRAAHVERCVICRSLLYGKPAPERIQRFMAVVDSRRARSHSAALKDFVIPWLALPNWEVDRLVTWLNKNSAPGKTISQSSEPYREVLQAITLDPERDRWEVELSKRVASLLEQICASSETACSDFLLVNVFKLCAGLSRPAQLGNALCEMSKVSLGHAEVERAWLGAVIRNQPDRRLQAVWVGVLKGQPQKFRATVRDALHGVLWMPGAAESDEADLETIGEAIRQIIEALPGQVARTAEFEQLLGEVKCARPAPQWDRRFIAMADAHRWPRWAVHRLNLYVEHEDAAFVWKHIAYTVRHAFPKVMLTRLCEGEVFQIRPLADAADLVRDIAPLLERRRLEWTDADPRGCSVESAEYLYDLAERFRRTKPDVARSIQFAAKDIQEEENVGITCD